MDSFLLLLHNTKLFPTLGNLNLLTKLLLTNQGIAKYLTTTMNSQLLELLKAKCKDMGLSEKAINDLASISAENLSTDASQEELQEYVNNLLPFAKIVQSESTRWAQVVKEKNNSQEHEVNSKPWQEEFQALKESCQETIDQIKKEADSFKALQQQYERKALIDQQKQKHGISDEDMKFVSIPQDADLEHFFTSFKQHLISKGLMEESQANMQIAKEHASQELAKSLMAEIEVKS